MSMSKQRSYLFGAGGRAGVTVRSRAEAALGGGKGDR